MNTPEQAKTLEQEFNAKIETHLRHYYKDCLGLYDWNRRVEDRKKEIPRAKAWLRAIEEISGLDLKGKKMLDIGCGWGGHIAAGAELGADCAGCDVDREALEVAELRTKLYGIRAKFYYTAAEKLPFADNEFDYVQTVAVLEHVQDVRQSIKEMVRVLKPEGVGFVHTPNYWIPIEPHYKIVFPSKCPKSLAKVYLRLLARPTDFIDSINYLDYKTVKKMFETFGASVTDIFKRFNELWQDYYQKEAGREEESMKIPVRSYNALAGKIMGRGSVIVRSIFQDFLGIRNVFFLFRKSGNRH